MAVKDVFKLRPASVSREVNWWLKSSPDEVQMTNCLAGILSKCGANIQRHDPDQLVAYFGSRAGAKMNGLRKCQPLELPTRVIFKTYDMQGQTIVRARMDDDFGLHFKIGSSRRRFREKYREAFDRISQAVLADLGEHSPEVDRVIFWK